MQIFYAMLPLIMIAITQIIDLFLGTRKVWLFSLPLVACVLFLQYPQIAASYGVTAILTNNTIASIVQGILTVLWLMFLLGGCHVTGFANQKNPIPRPIIVLLTILSLVFSFWLSWMTFTRGDSLRSTVLGTLGLSTIVFFAILRLLYHLVCPIIILKKENCKSPLSDYGKVILTKVNPLNFSVYNFVRFENDPEEYVISLFVYRKMKGRIRSVYSYRKCHCILGVIYIDRLELVTEHPRQLSTWGENIERPAHRKLSKLGIAAFVFILSVLFMLFAFIFIDP